MQAREACMHIYVYVYADVDACRLRACRLERLHISTTQVKHALNNTRMQARASMQTQLNNANGKPVLCPLLKADKPMLNGNRARG